MQEIDRYASERTSVLIVGNKSDLNNTRAVLSPEAKVLSLSLFLFETSAINGTNVEAAFSNLASQILGKL